MDVRSVDVRDQEWEIASPKYRATIWLPADMSDGSRVWAGDEYELADTDVVEALAWAQERTPEGAQFVLYAICAMPEAGLGVLRLAGNEPAWLHGGSGTFQVECGDEG